MKKKLDREQEKVRRTVLEKKIEEKNEEIALVNARLDAQKKVGDCLLSLFLSTATVHTLTPAHSLRHTFLNRDVYRPLPACAYSSLVLRGRSCLSCPVAAPWCCCCCS